MNDNRTGAKTGIAELKALKYNRTGEKTGISKLRVLNYNRTGASSEELSGQIIVHDAVTVRLA